MELGPFQKQWIEDLRINHKKQCTSSLGYKTDKSYKACCLGQALITYNRMFNLPEPFIVNDKIPGITGILNDNNDNLYLSFLYEKIGLYSESGDINNNIMIIDGVEYTTLSEANDEGVSWKDIADYVENNPENIFTKSV